MRLETTVRRRRLSLTSLIDVIFLLLLFFMLTSTFSRYGDVELAASGTGTNDSTPVTAFARLNSGGLSINGSPLEVGRLAQSLSALASENGVNALIIAVAESATSQQLIDVLVAVRAVDNVSIQLVK
ncbi:MAG: biopolymer transporter ExbD [Pseudomonadota bacterium]